jgi:hypothetical protein
MFVSTILWSCWQLIVPPIPQTDEETTVNSRTSSTETVGLHLMICLYRTHCCLAIGIVFYVYMLSTRLNRGNSVRFSYYFDSPHNLESLFRNFYACECYSKTSSVACWTTSYATDRRDNYVKSVSKTAAGVYRSQFKTFLDFSNFFFRC